MKERINMLGGLTYEQTNKLVGGRIYERMNNIVGGDICTNDHVGWGEIQMNSKGGTNI